MRVFFCKARVHCAWWKRQNRQANEPETTRCHVHLIIAVIERGTRMNGQLVGSVARKKRKPSMTYGMPVREMRWRYASMAAKVFTREELVAKINLLDPTISITQRISTRRLAHLLAWILFPPERSRRYRRY